MRIYVWWDFCYRATPRSFLQLFLARRGAGFHEQFGGIPSDRERADPLEQRAQLAGIREQAGRIAKVQGGDDANGLGRGIQCAKFHRTIGYPPKPD